MYLTRYDIMILVVLKSLAVFRLGRKQYIHLFNINMPVEYRDTINPRISLMRVCLF